jgi:glycerol-3-phosphate acyltransferase PlsY
MVSKVVFLRDDFTDIEVEVPGTNETYRVTSTGAAAASMNLGARAGCTIAFLDMAKIAIPTLVIRFAFQPADYHLITAVAGMIGHDWSIFNRFRGGRGVSSVYGALLVIDWLGALSVSTAGLVIGLLVFRDFFLAYFSGLWLLIPWMWFMTHDWNYLAFAIGVNVILLLAMLPDIRQYVKFKRQRRVDLQVVLSTTPMGRGMQQIMDWLRLGRK